MQQTDLCQCQCQRRFIEHINVKSLMLRMHKYEANINVFQRCLDVSRPTVYRLQTARNA